MEKNESIAFGHYDLGLRIYNPETARMFSIDPREKEYAWQSPYVYHRNSPIALIDFLGGGDPPAPEDAEDDFECENCLESVTVVADYISDITGDEGYDWKPLTAAKLDEFTTQDSNTSGYVLEDAFSRWAESSAIFIGLGYERQKESDLYYAPDWDRNTAFDGKSYAVHTDISFRHDVPSSASLGVIFYEVKRMQKSKASKSKRQLGAQVNAIAKNFPEEVKNKSAFYYLITTSDVTDVTDVNEYAVRSGLTMGHYVPYYRVSDDNTIMVKFMARGIGFLYGNWGDLNIMGGNEMTSNQDGVKLYNENWKNER